MYVPGAGGAAVGDKELLFMGTVSVWEDENVIEMVGMVVQKCGAN